MLTTVVGLACAMLGTGLPGSGKIKHVIILMEENRSFDHMFGWLNRVRAKGARVNGLTGNETNIVTQKDGKRVRVAVDDKAPQIRYPLCDPDHSTPATTEKIFGTSREAHMSGFAQYEYNRGNEDSEYCGVLSMFAPENVPILTQLAMEYALFDEFFCAHPGPTWPNRMYAISATSAGSTETGTWYRNEQGALFPQKTIMDQVAGAGLTWRNYFNDTPWELFMESIAHNPDNTRTLDDFFTDAARGTLPNYAWINPRSGINVTTGVGSNDQHPDHDVAAGEAYYKDIYEALRASPQWSETLFVITYDEHGGFYDHVVPPSAPPPHKGMESYPDKGFAFDRLGVRVPTLLISPWIKKGAVIPAPPRAAYDLTTLVATTRKLLNVPDEPLTERDAWVATFEHVLDELDAPRTDCPKHLVDPVPTTRPADGKLPEAELGLNSLQTHIGATLAHAAGKHTYRDHNDFGKREGIHKQGDVSEHLQGLHAEHVTRMSELRKTHAEELAKYRAQYSLVVTPLTTSGFINQFVITDLPHHDAPFSEIHTYQAVSGVKLCLDIGTDPVKIAAGQHVGVSACTSSLPAARSQRWIIRRDATIRPFYAQNMCLTNTCPEGACLHGRYPVILTPCAEGATEVAQHWAYHGPAPGTPPTRGIYFGDLQNLLTIVQ